MHVPPDIKEKLVDLSDRLKSLSECTHAASEGQAASLVILGEGLIFNEDNNRVLGVTISPDLYHWLVYHGSLRKDRNKE